MARIPLIKNYREAAQAILDRLVKNGTLEEVPDDVISGQTMIEVIGDLEIFDAYEMDTWGGRMKFVVRDTEAKDDESRAWRGEVAMLNPELAAMFTAKAAMSVFQSQVVTTRVTTEQFIQGKPIPGSQGVEETTEERWVEITEEFAKRAQRDKQFRIG